MIPQLKVQCLVMMHGMPLISSRRRLHEVSSKSVPVAFIQFNLIRIEISQGSKRRKVEFKREMWIEIELVIMKHFRARIFFPNCFNLLITRNGSERD